MVCHQKRPCMADRKRETLSTSERFNNETLIEKSTLQTESEHIESYDDLTLCDSTSTYINCKTVYNDITQSDTSLCMKPSQHSIDLGLSDKGLKIGHINIQGIQNKFDQIELMLNNTENNIHIFGSSTLPRPYYIHPTFTSIVIADYSLNA